MILSSMSSFQVEKLQYRVDEMEMAQRDGISEYEQQVMHLKEEVSVLQHNIQLKITYN
jgi:hypothetical protein